MFLEIAYYNREYQHLKQIARKPEYLESQYL